MFFSLRKARVPAALVAALLIFCAGCSEESQPAPSGTNAPIVIIPQTSVGNVRAGITLEQVTAELGQPQRKTAKALEYTRLGLAVLPNSNGVVEVVMCGDVTGINGPLVKAFAGRTKEGIGMNSSREEVVKAFGEPTSSERFPGRIESLQYQPLGMTFTLEGGKVHHIIVRFRNTRATDRTVNLEPAPSPSQK